MPTSFVPTRYLSYSYADDGSFILSNSLTGAIGAIPVEQASFVRQALQRSARHPEPLQGILADLQEGGFLVREGTDERAISERQFLNRYNDRTLHLILLPTEQCNFRCAYCYESFLRGAMSKGIREGIKRYVAGEKKLENLNISWFGGEPLAAADVVIELSQFFHRHCTEHHIEYIVSMTTNGYFLTPEIAETIIPLGVRQFQITLDGVAEEHDQRRVLEDGGKTFEVIFQNLRYLKSTEHAFAVMIRHNYDPASLKRLQDFIDLIKQEFGADPRFSMYFVPIGKWGGSNDDDLSVCEGHSLIDTYLHGKRLAIEAGLRNALLVERMKPNSYVCYAAHPRSFVVGSNGDLYKCTVELDYHDRNIVGHLYEDGHMELDWRKMALWCETNGMEEGKKCYSCFFSPACHGAACPKDWLDEPECICPPEKVGIRKVLPMIYKASRLMQPTASESPTQCLK